MDIFLECLKAFLVGGIFCAIGQVLMDYSKLTPARILVSYVCVGVLLGGLGIYKPLVDFAGAGATVPLTGFGYILAQGIEDAIATDGMFGILTGGFIAGAGGIAAAILFGFIIALISKAKDKA